MDGVQLRRLSKSDATQIAKLANNKKIWDNLRDYIPYPYSEEDALFFIGLTEKEFPEQTFGIIEENGDLCGVIGLVKQSDVYQLTAEIGYWLGEEFWGKGIMTEAVRLITQYGFEKLRIERIYTGVFSFNIGSIKVLEKSGYNKEGIFKNAILKNGAICDEHRYAILKSEHMKKDEL